METPALAPLDVLDKKYISARIKMSGQSALPHYITVRNHFVTIRDNQLIVLGDVVKNDDVRFPCLVILQNKKDYLLIRNDGSLYHSNGTLAGEIFG